MKYLRYAVVVAFVACMIYLVFAVVNNHARTSKTLEQVAAPVIAPPPPVAYSKKDSEPIGGAGDLPDKESAPPPPPMNKVKVLGIVELELSQANTWSSVLQILAIILGSALGIRIINTTFKKIEQPQ